MNLLIKTSQIPGAGMGLYSNDAIAKDTIIVEYTGEITNWAKVKDDWQNVYIYFLSDDHVINAKNYPDVYARYANDARGSAKVKTLRNNSEFVNIDDRVYIRSINDIAAGEEILVGYGEDYWKTIRKNSV